MSLNFSTKSASIKEETLFGSIGELENAVITFLWRSEKSRLGDFSVTFSVKSISQLLEDRDAS